MPAAPPAPTTTQEPSVAHTSRMFPVGKASVLVTLDGFQPVLVVCQMSRSRFIITRQNGNKYSFTGNKRAALPHIQAARQNAHTERLTDFAAALQRVQILIYNALHAPAAA